MSVRTVQVSLSQIPTAAALLESKPVHMKTPGMICQLTCPVKFSVMRSSSVSWPFTVAIFIPINTLNSACLPLQLILGAESSYCCSVHYFISCLLYTDKMHSSIKEAQKRITISIQMMKHVVWANMFQLFSTDLWLCPTPFSPSTTTLRASTLQQLHVRLVLCQPETILTILLQKRQGPEPSCSHTMRPHFRQLFTSLCLLAWQSQGWRPEK